MSFLKDITHRDDKGSSKKLWYNGAALTATIVLLWVAYKDNMEDWAFITFYAVYLGTVGGFEVVLKIMDMLIQFKNGKRENINASDTDTSNTMGQPTPGS